MTFLVILLMATVIFNLPFRDSTGFSREWNSSLHKSQDVRAESPWLTDDLCGKVLITTGHCSACPPQSAFPAAPPPSPLFHPLSWIPCHSSLSWVYFLHPYSTGTAYLGTQLSHNQTDSWDRIIPMGLSKQLFNGWKGYLLKRIFMNQSQLKNPVGGPDTEASLKKLHLKW